MHSAGSGTHLTFVVEQKWPPMVPGLAVVGHNADSGTCTREKLVKQDDRGGLVWYNLDPFGTEVCTMAHLVMYLVTL